MSYVFRSKLADPIIKFLDYKHSMGYKYNSGEQTLSELDRHFISHGLDSRLTKEAVEGWIFEKEAARPSPYRHYLSAVREFGRFLQDNGFADAYVVSDSFVSTNQRPTPYFLSEKEIAAFFDAAARYMSRNHGRGRYLTLPAFFMLMNCCGLRTIEARSLLTSAVHLAEGYIDIIASKRHRDRRVFLSGELARWLAGYDEKIASVFPGRLHFFPSSETTMISSSSIGQHFNRIWDSAGLPGRSGKQPRPYDFRHHFAFANINRWTAEGRNVNAMLPYLMRYMGHNSLESTYYYVHLVPDFSGDYIRIAAPLDDMIPEVCHES